MKKLLIICSGGNSIGMGNCVIEIGHKCIAYGFEPWFAYYGLKGIFNNDIHKLNGEEILGKENSGSSIIGTSRFDEFKQKNVQGQIIENIKKHNFDVVIIIGGNGSFEVCKILAKSEIKTMFIPATIDNDVAWTNYCIGFDTALAQIVKCCKDLDICYKAHQGIDFVEVMGRDCADLAVWAGFLTNANYVVTKYNKINQDKYIEIANDCFENGATNVRFIITENLYDEHGNENLRKIKEYVKSKTNRYCELDNLGHLQRGGNPTEREKQFVKWYIDKTFECILQEKFNQAVGFKDGDTITVDIFDADKIKRDETPTITFLNKINKKEA